MIKSKIIAVVAAFAMFAVAAGTSAAYMFNTNMGFGMRSNDVKELQLRLNSEVGTSLPGTTYFGSLTRTAVKSYQSMKGISPVSGYVGPLTRAALNGSTPSTPSTPTQTGAVTAMLATTNPASSTLVAGQATADLAQFTFNGNGTVTGVTLQRIGVSADATPSNVYLFDGATRLTDASSVSSNGMVTFNVPAGLFTVSGSKTITVKSDIASGSSGQTVGVKLVSFMTSGSATAITANITGNLHSIATAGLAGVSAGTVTPSGATINPGTNQTLWQSTLTVSTRNVLMKRIAFRQVGSAPASSFANFKLYVNGVQVATATGIDAMGYVTFDMRSAPVELVSGSRVVRVDADVVSGASRTVQLSLRTAADVDFVDSSFGVNVSPTLAPWVSSSASTISGSSGGTLTIEKDVTSPSTNLVNNGSDVNIGTFKVTAFGEPIKIETLRASYDSSDNNISSLRNGRILINGVQYGSTATLNEKDSGSAYTSYTLNYTVYPGTPVMVELHADIYDNDGTDSISAGTDTINAQISAGSSNAQRMDSLGTFSAPASAVTSNTLTIASTSMTLSKNGTYANQTTTLPATNFKLGSWNLVGSSIEDILLTTLSFDIDESNTTTDFDEEDLNNMYVVVKNGSTVVAQPAPISTLSSDGQDNNFSINYTLPKNASVSIELFANLSDTGTPSAVDANDQIVTDLTVSGTSMTGGSSVTATSADTAGQTVTYGSPTLTAVLDASSPVIALVADNQTIDAAAFKFTALTADAKVTDLTFTIPSSGATVASTISLYDGATMVASQAAGTTSVTFSGLNWNIPANSSKVLTVKLALGNIASVGGGTTGATLTTTLTSFTAVQAGTSDVSGNDSGPSIENDPAGVALVARAAYPTISQVNVSTSLVNAIENDMMSFTVTPNGGPVAVKQLKFTVVVNDNVGTNDTLTVGTFKLFRGSTDITSLVDIHNTAGATIESTNSLAEGTSTAIVTWSTEEQISTATTFTLKATPTGFSTAADDDYISTNLAYDSSAHTLANSYLIDLDTTGAQVSVGLAPSTGTAQDDSAHGTDQATVTDGPNILWSDISSTSHAATVVDAGSTPSSSADWANGYLIQSLPLSGATKNN